MFKNKLYPIVFVLLIAGLVLAACGTGNQPAPTVGPIQAAGTAAMSTIEAAVAANRAAAEQATADEIMSGAAGTAAALTGGAIPSTETPMPGATAPVSVAPTTGPATLPTGLLVTALKWTPWDLNNLVIPGATIVRPTKPFEGQVPMPIMSSVVYQLKTDLDDTDPAGTWKPGQLIYEYDVPSGWQPQYLGTQGDTNVSLCWQREEKDGNSGTLETQVLMKTQNGNGASALISFLPVSTANTPPIGQRCAAP